MKLSIERNAFLKALNHGQSIIEKRTTLPILAHILLTAENNSLKLTSTDLEISAIEIIDADVEVAGQTTVSAHLLYDIVRKLHDGSKITISLDEQKGQIFIVSGRSQFHLPYLPAEDFPAINFAQLPYNFSLSIADMRHLIEKTKFAMSSEETRYFLNGIYFHTVDEQYFRAVATDGHRLAHATIRIPEGAQGMPGVIVSRKTVGELIRLLNESNDNEIQISISPTQIAFKLSNLYLTSRLLDGQYPPYQEAIPKNNKNLMHVHVKSLAKAVDRVATISTDKFSAVKMLVNEGKVTLNASNEMTGAAEEELEVAYTAEPIVIGFNAKYLLDITQQIETEEAEFWLSDGSTPIIIKSINEDKYLYVLMPMRL